MFPLDLASRVTCRCGQGPSAIPGVHLGLWTLRPQAGACRAGAMGGEGSSRGQGRGCCHRRSPWLPGDTQAASV